MGILAERKIETGVFRSMRNVERHVQNETDDLNNIETEELNQNTTEEHAHL